MAELVQTDDERFLRSIAKRPYGAVTAADFMRVWHLAMRALSAPATQQTVNISALPVSGRRNDLWKWAEKTAKYIDYFRGSPLFDLKAYLYERAEALSRSHEDGRRAGLEEAARECSDVAWVALSDERRESAETCAEAIRALKTPKGVK